MQHRLHAVGVEVGPQPGEHVGAALAAEHELGGVADLRLLGRDRFEVCDLTLGDDREVAGLTKAEALRSGLEDLDRPAHHVGHRRGAVIPAHDPAGDPRGPRADPVLLEEHDLLAAAGQRRGRGQPEHAAADDHARRPPRQSRAAQLHGYGLWETGCSAPVAKRS